VHHGLSPALHSGRLLGAAGVVLPLQQRLEVAEPPNIHETSFMPGETAALQVLCCMLIAPRLQKSAHLIRVCARNRRTAADSVTPNPRRTQRKAAGSLSGASSQRHRNDNGAAAVANRD